MLVNENEYPSFRFILFNFISVFRWNSHSQKGFEIINNFHWNQSIVKCGGSIGNGSRPGSPHQTANNDERRNPHLHSAVLRTAVEKIHGIAKHPINARVLGVIATIYFASFYRRSTVEIQCAGILPKRVRVPIWKIKAKFGLTLFIRGANLSSF